MLDDSMKKLFYSKI